MFAFPSLCSIHQLWLAAFGTFRLLTRSQFQTHSFPSAKSTPHDKSIFSVHHTFALSGPDAVDAYLITQYLGIPLLKNSVQKSDRFAYHPPNDNTGPEVLPGKVPARA